MRVSGSVEGEEAVWSKERERVGGAVEVRPVQPPKAGRSSPPRGSPARRQQNRPKTPFAPKVQRAIVRLLGDFARAAGASQVPERSAAGTVRAPMKFPLRREIPDTVPAARSSGEELR